MKARSFKPFPREPWSRIIGIPLVGLLLTTLYHDPPYRWQDIAQAVLTTGIIWQSDYWILCAYRKKFPGVENTPRRMFWTIATVVVVNSLLDPLSCHAFYWVGMCERPEDVLFSAQNLQKNFGVTIIIGSLYEAGYFFDQWKRQSAIADQALSRQLKSELNVLKNQISPHFLFNSLNTLSALIDENPVKASEFTQNLSRVYRYILQYKDEELVELGTELDFVLDYYSLMRMRFENGLALRVSIEKERRGYSIPPLTLQILVENAIKHNVVSASKPLVIDLSIDENRNLVVSNNLQLKRQAEPSTGTGLVNIQKRYELFTDRDVDIFETRDRFAVLLPLLDPMTPTRPISV